MIKLVRVDHRLIHGQVAFTWTKFLSTDCILIASDDLLKDELRMAGLKMAKPSNVKLVMKSIADSIKALNSGVTDKYNLLILCESVEDVYRLTRVSPIACIIHWSNYLGHNMTVLYRSEINRRIINNLIRLLGIRYHHRSGLNSTNWLFGWVCVCSIVANPNHLSRNIFQSFRVIKIRKRFRLLRS